METKPLQKPESTPILPCGQVVVTLLQLKRLTVDSFTKETRPKIFAAFLNIVRLIKESGIGCEMWIDGSYLTNKTAPKDIDFSCIFNGIELDALPDDQKTRFSEAWRSVERHD